MFFIHVNKSKSPFIANSFKDMIEIVKHQLSIGSKIDVYQDIQNITFYVLGAINNISISSF